MSGKLRVYNGFIRNSFMNMLAYRMRYYTGILTYLLFVSVHYFIWNATFAGKAPGETINGFTLPEMITYIVVGWVSRSLYFSDIDYDIDEIARTGQIGIYLLRPVDFQTMMIVSAFGSCLFRAVFFTLPVAICILSLFPVSLPPNWMSFFLFCLSTLGAFILLAEINFLVGLLAFSLKSISGFIRAKYYIVQLCSGLLIPFTFFPGWAQKILEWLPFQGLTYIPVGMYLGKFSGAEIVQAFATQIGWTLLLAILGKYFWDRAVAKLTVQGG